MWLPQGHPESMWSLGLTFFLPNTERAVGVRASVGDLKAYVREAGTLSEHHGAIQVKVNEVQLY